MTSRAVAAYKELFLVSESETVKRREQEPQKFRDVADLFPRPDALSAEAVLN